MNVLPDCLRACPPERTAEEQRRWELVTYAILVAWGFQPGDPFTGWDRYALEHARAVLYPDDSLPTGEGDLSEAQRAWLKTLHLL